jgi:hypothetical protein
MKPQTLMVAIQCVASEIKSLDVKLESGQIEDEVEAEQMLLSWELALDDLKEAYEIALQKYSSMPTYKQLLESI